MQITINPILHNNKPTFSGLPAKKPKIPVAIQSEKILPKFMSAAATAGITGILVSKKNEQEKLNTFSKKNCLTLEMVQDLKRDMIYVPENWKTELEKIIKKIALDENLDTEYKYLISRRLILLSAAGVLQPNAQELIQSLNELYKTVSSHSELYVNENDYTPLEFFENNAERLFLALELFDKETVNIILRKRFNTAKDYLESIDGFSKEYREIIKNIIKSKENEGRPLNAREQIELFNLFNALIKKRIKITDNMVTNSQGEYDLKKLQKSVLNKFLRMADFTDEDIARIPQDKLEGWNYEYLPLLVASMQYEGYLFKELMKIDLLGDFDEYMKNENTRHGKINAKTKQQFTERKMSYNNWVKPKKELELQLCVKNEGREELMSLAQKVTKTVESLRKTKAGKFVDKQLGQYIINDKFVIPEEKIKTKQMLLSFIANIIKQLDSVWKRAEITINSNITANIEIAKKSLRAKKTLEKIEDKIFLISDKKFQNPLNLTIKMWDRIPKKDIFQGNYTNCCIGVGRNQATAIPTYITNTAFNVIEVLDNESGEVVGNALCYFADAANGNPILVIDNIEIAGALNLSAKTDKQLFDTIINYAHSVAKDVTGNDDVEIYLGGIVNDLNCPYNNEDKEISFIGDISEDFIYLDAYNSAAVEKHNLKDICWLQRVK